MPTDFTDYRKLAGRGAAARLIVFAGLSGAGKSTLAETAGRELGVPVFAVDWLLGSLTPFGGYHLEELFKMGGELGHDAGTWANVERRLAEFPSWTGQVLTVDAVQPLSVTLATVRTYVTA